MRSDETARLLNLFKRARFSIDDLKLKIYAITASSPCSNPHVFTIHSGSVRGASLFSHKFTDFTNVYI
jgi:hypothetical protein